MPVSLELPQQGGANGRFMDNLAWRASDRLGGLRGTTARAGPRSPEAAISSNRSPLVSIHGSRELVLALLLRNSIALHHDLPAAERLRSLGVEKFVYYYLFNIRNDETF